jgi:hypothetical protein
MAGSVASELARSSVGLSGERKDATMRKCLHVEEVVRGRAKVRALIRTARCAVRCITAEPGQRGERPPRSGRALTGAHARRPSARPWRSLPPLPRSRHDRCRAERLVECMSMIATASRLAPIRERAGVLSRVKVALAPLAAPVTRRERP